MIRVLAHGMMARAAIKPMIGEQYCSIPLSAGSCLNQSPNRKNMKSSGNMERSGMTLVGIQISKTVHAKSD